MQKIPKYLFDWKGKPTNDWIEFLENYQPCYDLPAWYFVFDILRHGWYFEDDGFEITKKKEGVYELILSTNGNKNNEIIIEAIKSNKHLIDSEDMRLVLEIPGGHYFFEFKVDYEIKKPRTNGA
jgi:hypothetical protein